MAIDPRTQRGPYVPVARRGDSPTPGVGAVEGATAAEMSQARFGGPIRTQTSVVTFQAAWGQVLAANPRRVFWTMINRAVVDVAIDFDSGSAFANGIPLGASGGYAQADVEEDGESVAWPVFGAASSGTATVRVVEVIRV